MTFWHSPRHFITAARCWRHVGGIGSFEVEITHSKTDEVRHVAVENRDPLLELKAALKL